MGIVKRMFGDLLSRYRYDVDGSSSSSADSESEDMELEDADACCESETLVLDGQTDIRSYFPASWRWDPPADADEEAAKAMGFDFHMMDENEMAEIQLHSTSTDDEEALAAYEGAASAMGLPFHLHDDGLEIPPDVEATEHAESWAAFEDAATAMALSFDMKGPEKHVSTNRVPISPNTPQPRRRPREVLEETPCKKPRMAERVNCFVKPVEGKLETSADARGRESPLASMAF